jgi:hypothetical protein
MVGSSQWMPLRLDASPAAACSSIHKNMIVETMYQTPNI